MERLDEEFIERSGTWFNGGNKAIQFNIHSILFNIFTNNGFDFQTVKFDLKQKYYADQFMTNLRLYLHT